jgi:hypothetical protein
MNDTFIFCGFEFWRMCMYRRRFSRMRVHVEKRCIEHREEKRRDRDAGRQFLHGGILLVLPLKVNGTTCGW